jgi:hypothetical protein
MSVVVVVVVVVVVRTRAEAGKIIFILTSNHILDHCSKIDLRSLQDHVADQ